ncbi:MAG: adenylate cyclase [Gemmatimonadota bacterium]
MSWEIERRYLIRVPDDAWATFGPGTPLRQGYVVAGPAAVRIRAGEPRGFVLTCKSGSGVRRKEVEVVVPAEMAEALFDVAGERVIEKVRHRVGPWEVDRFQGPLAGLALLEIELEDEQQAVPAPPRNISIIQEVTDDKRFVSSMLASMSREEQEQWVRHVYIELGT